MDNGILSVDISQQDALVSSASIEQLRSYLTEGERSVVFFVGAGASAAGNTQMPTTPALLRQILMDSLNRSGGFSAESNGLADHIGETSYRIGFEITLNDFWQICRQATTLLYTAFAELEEKCTPNFVHTFLAYWLSTGGIVLTTNYDRLIEREWVKVEQGINVRYQEVGSNSFANWQEDLKRGGCLFKLHGSLDAPDSCLGALEHVTTHLAGNRASLLAEIIQHRPLCFVGWRGVDPDIPPLLSKLYKPKDPSLPIFWVHYEGRQPGSISLQTAIDDVPPLIRECATAHPILTDADRAFGEMLRWIGLEPTPKPSPVAIQLDFSKAVSQCSLPDITRFVGIAVRRAGQHDIARQILQMALRLSQTPKERSATLSELSLLQQQEAGRKTDPSRKLLKEAHKSLREKPDPWLQLNTDFGMLSMTIVALQSRPWLLLKLPTLFRKYRQSIEALRKQAIDRETVALHESLFHLYLGRLLLILFNWLAVAVPFLADWILQPFNVARSTIDDAKEIHLHSRIDVLAYRAVALARLRRCQNATEDIPEIGRLIAILNDHARAKHWEHQSHEIEHRCSNTVKPRKS